MEVDAHPRVVPPDVAYTLLRHIQAPLRIVPEVRFATSEGLVPFNRLQELRRAQRWSALPYRELPPGDVLVIRHGGLGDILLLQPALRELQSRRPDISLRVATAHPLAVTVAPARYEITASEHTTVIELAWWVEGHPLRDYVHRTDLFADGLGLDGVRSYDFSVRYDGPPVIAGEYALVQAATDRRDGHPRLPFVQALCDALRQRLGLAVCAIATEALPLKVEYNMTGRLSQEALWSLVKYAAVTVAWDSGPFHLARAMRRPCVGIYGPYPPELRVAEPWPNCRVYVAPVVAEGRCRPCFGEMKCSRIAPRCLEQLHPHEVAALCEQLLSTETVAWQQKSPTQET